MVRGGRPVLRIPGTLGEARAIQEAVAREAAAAPRISLDQVHTVGGADASYSRDGKMVHAAAVVLGLPFLAVLEESTCSCGVCFPYLPGYFAFREGPALVGAVGALKQKPGLLSWTGMASPTRAGPGSRSTSGSSWGSPRSGSRKASSAGMPPCPGWPAGRWRPSWMRAGSSVWRSGPGQGPARCTSPPAMPRTLKPPWR